MAAANAPSPSVAPIPFIAVRRLTSPRTGSVTVVGSLPAGSLLALSLMMNLVSARRQESIVRSETWEHPRKGGSMRIVAINAVLSLAWAASEIPITVHAAVSAMFVVARLGGMALRANQLDLGHILRAAIGQTEATVVVGVMATQARQLAVLKGQSLMELRQLISGIDPRIRPQTGMATGTGHGHRVS
jgi:hypothetical protein